MLQIETKTIYGIAKMIHTTYSYTTYGIAKMIHTIYRYTTYGVAKMIHHKRGSLQNYICKSEIPKLRYLLDFKSEIPKFKKYL